MRAAGTIFLVTGLAYLGWGVRTIAAYGLPMSWAGLRYWGVTAAFLCVAYGLFRAKVGARWLAIFVSAILVAGCCVALYVLLQGSGSNIVDITFDEWVIRGVFLTVCIAHLTAILLLLFAKRAPSVAT